LDYHLRLCLTSDCSRCHVFRSNVLQPLQLEHFPGSIDHIFLLHLPFCRNQDHSRAMASSPPESPSGLPQRPMSVVMKPPRSSSRMSMTSKAGGGSRASDEDGKTSVKVGMINKPFLKDF